MKILYVTTLGCTMNFFYEEFKHLKEQGHTVELACNNSTPYSEATSSLGLKHYEICFSRSPLDKRNLIACRQLKELIEKKHYDIVHCHTPNAAAITRLVCKNFRKGGLKVFYTAHGFHFFKGAPLKNWLLYYPVEWICAHWTDTLITINKEDYKLARRHMHAKNVRYVPGVGIDLSKYSTRLFSKEECDTVRDKIGIPRGAIWLLSVGELNDNKNHETVLRALVDIKDVYYTVAGRGEKLGELISLTREFGIEERVKFLGYRDDISLLCEAADVFVMPSYREGLSVALMEAMASGMPCCVSRIRGNVDLINKKGGTLFDPNSVYDCRKAIKEMLSCNFENFGAYNRNRIKHFDKKIVEDAISKVYSEIGGGIASR